MRTVGLSGVPADTHLLLQIPTSTTVTGNPNTGVPVTATTFGRLVAAAPELGNSNVQCLGCTAPARVFVQNHRSVNRRLHRFALLPQVFA
jgi:hypothetical protein